MVRATPWHVIAPATRWMKELVGFSCRCTRKHAETVRVNGRWTRVNRGIHLKGVVCGRLERRVRPSRGPMPWVCDVCLGAYEKDYSDAKRHWVDPSPVERLEAMFPESVAVDLRYGTYRFGKNLVAMEAGKPHAD